MGERPSEFRRVDNDWYVEPTWAVTLLADRIAFVGAIHDPCCGMGTIPKALNGTGSDIVDRGYGYPVADFLKDATPRVNIVTNPPYNIAQQIIEHALTVAGDRVVALVQTKFLSSQRRHALFSRPEMEAVYVFSRRPSMPPGQELRAHGESIRGGGSIDFCWVIWRQKHSGPVKLGWLK